MTTGETAPAIENRRFTRYSMHALSPMPKHFAYLPQAEKSDISRRLPAVQPFDAFLERGLADGEIGDRQLVERAAGERADVGAIDVEIGGKAVGAPEAREGRERGLAHAFRKHEAHFLPVGER